MQDDDAGRLDQRLVIDEAVIAVIADLVQRDVESSEDRSAEGFSVKTVPRASSERMSTKAAE